ncbi:MAG: DUF1684 domain-containing protein [Actinomycetota bacterium]|nr:DUF1684 domain-containing protein [Actinomycetota bacterium]
MYEDEVAKWRAERDDFFGSHYASPLSDEVMAAFVGLAYFGVDPALVFEVAMEEAGSDLEITSSTGGSSRYPVAGAVTVPFPDGSKTLIALRGEEDEIFIPFRDATSGAESYGGGRYAPLEPEQGGRFVVDFNRAINPYCAYDEDFSCPLPPAQNWIDHPIEAGEMDYRST